MMLEDLLKIDKARAIGHLCLLWAWALDNAPEGDISKLSPKRIAMIAHYSQSKAKAFVEALISSGFLDSDGESLRIHDWADYAGRYSEMKRRNRERQRNFRKRRSEADCNGDGSVRSQLHNSSVTPLQDRTEQDRTEQNITEQKNISGGGDPSACVREDESEALGEYFLGRGLIPESYLGASGELIAESGRLCEELFRKFCNRAPTEYDKARVFSALMRDGEIRPELLEKLCYSFEAAAAAGKGGDWRYMEGVSGRLSRRGLENLRDIEYYEMERDE